MLKSITAKVTISVAAAALLTVLGIVSASVAPPAKADLLATGRPDRPYAKADRLSVAVKGTACSSRGWPNYEPSCQFDMRRPANEARTVRVIALR